MGQYRKKPVVIEAVQLGFRSESLEEVAQFIGGDTAENIFENYEEGEVRTYIEIETLEGVMRASVGDWIIRGVQGEFYPCKPDIFEATYEKVID